MAVQEKAPAEQPVRQERVHTPTVLQMEAVECGAASLGIILGYFGRYVPLEELRAACAVGRDGSKASNIVKAARTYGLQAGGYRQESASLRTLKLPVVVFWNFYHFLVVEGFGNGKVYLNDPESGPRTVTEEEFDKSFTGVVLTFEPGPDFHRGGRKPSAIPALKQRLRGSGRTLLLAVLASLCLGAALAATPVFTRVFIDQYIAFGSTAWLPALFGSMAATIGLIVAAAWLQQRVLLRLETRLALSQSAAFLWHMLRMPIVFFTQRSAGELSNRVTLNDAVARLLSGDLATNILGVITLVIYLVVMVRYDVTLTAISIAFAALNLAALHWVARRRKDQNQRLLAQRGRLVGTTANGLRLIETIKAEGSESDFFARWAGVQAQALTAEQSLGVSTQLLSAAPALLTALNTAVILSLGGLRVIDGTLSIGALIAFQILAIAFMLPITNMVNLASSLQEAEGNMTRLDDVLHYPEDPVLLADEALPDVESAPRLVGAVELRDVTFGYSTIDPPLFDHFNLSLAPGARVALVGGSGSGKSTIAKLVTGVYEPWSGDILFDGIPRAAIPRPLLTSSVAAATQEIALFEGTVRDNLTMWDSTIPDEIVIQAARDACIHDDIAARPGSYDFELSEEGANFSGGQRQRLEIARALVNEPSILVLDEATSALDPVTEVLIDENIRQRGCTCLIIAHRLSTIRDCDEIIVLEHGRIVQRGTHDTLRAQTGPYATLMQAGEAAEDEEMAS